MYAGYPAVPVDNEKSKTRRIVGGRRRVEQMVIDADTFLKQASLI